LFFTSLKYERADLSKTTAISFLPKFLVLGFQSSTRHFD